MLPLVSGGLITAALLWFALLMWRFPAYMGLFVLAAVVLLDSLQISLGEINAGVTIYQDDLACAALVAGAAIVAFRNRTFPRYLCSPALALLGLAGLNFARGTLLFGLKPAGNGVRGLIFFIVPFLATSVIGPALQLTCSRATSWLYGAAFLFTGVTLCRWAGLFPVPEILLVDEFRQIPRVLGADYPMIIGQALIAVVGSQLSRGVQLSGVLKAFLLGAVVLLLQHRSVWLATAAGLACLVFRSLRYASLRQCMHFAAAAAAAATLASLLVVASGRATQFIAMLTVNIEETTQEDSSFAWRVNGFHEAIDRTFSGGPVEIVVGPPSGRDLTDVASVASTHIHNRYIDTLAYYGVLGLLLLLAWFWTLAARVVRMKTATMDQSRGDMARSILQAILLSEFAYFLGYYGNLLHGAVLGLLWVASYDLSATRPHPAVAPPKASVVSDPILT